MRNIDLSIIQSLLKAEMPKIIGNSRCSDEFHDNLRNYLFLLAEKFDCKGKIKYITSDRRKIDVVWLDNTGNIKIAFEVDGGLRKRSIQRLIDFVADKKVWLFYGNSKKVKEFIRKHDCENSIILLNLGKIRKQVRGMNKKNSYLKNNTKLELASFIN